MFDALSSKLRTDAEPNGAGDGEVEEEEDGTSEGFVRSALVYC